MGKQYILLKPGQDPITDYPTAGRAPRSIAMRWSGPFVLVVLLGAGVLCSRSAFAAPAPTPIPTLADLPTVTVTHTPTATETPTASPTLAPSATATETPTASPTASPSPTITASPTITLPPYIQGVVAGARELNARFGPGREYPAVLQLAEGQTVTLVGRDHGATWGQIEISAGSFLWVRMNYIVTVNGESIARLPIVAAPPQ